MFLRRLLLRGQLERTAALDVNVSNLSCVQSQQHSMAARFAASREPEATLVRSAPMLVTCRFHEETGRADPRPAGSKRSAPSQLDPFPPSVPPQNWAVKERKQP